MTLETAPLGLSARTTRFPLRVRVQRHVDALISLAAALEARDEDAIAAWDDDLDRAAAVHEVSVDAPPTGAVSPTVRAKALAAVLVDLARSGWDVCVEDRQVYVSAPRWSAGAAGLSDDLVRAEKARARAAMAARVQEEIESESTRRFVLRMESARATEAGPRSVLSLMADGRALAESLRCHGANGFKPYLQRADGDAGRDPHTGLAYVEVFRYFRLFWSFPTSAPPGRSISYLLRDAGQPGHPVCALVCVASPVPRLSARDAALGWTAAWLEAVVRALDLPADHLEQHLRDAEERAIAGEANGASLILDLSHLLGLAPTRDARTVARVLDHLTPRERDARADRARRRILNDLRDEVTNALDQISFDGFGFASAYALEHPGEAVERLDGQRAAAFDRWRESRRVRAQGPSSPRLDSGAVASGEDLRVAARDPLFFKKRVTQAARALRAWAEIKPIPRERASDRLRSLVLARDGASPRTTTISRGLRFALLLRQNRFVASQVLDVCVCGAIPPYGPLLVGKLAALAALSRDVANDYHQRYAGRPSEISSQMAGRPVDRATDLVALTTTSFYGVGSSQYERLALQRDGGPDVRWRRVGFTRGNGTLHFSRRTSQLMDQLLCLETGARLITSRFGEGPSERLRKIRDGLELLGIDAGELLRHGMPRVVYVAELEPGASRPGAEKKCPVWRRVGPSLNEVASAWRERWLTRRLAHPGVLEEIEAFDRVNALLSMKLRRRGGGGRR